MIDMPNEKKKKEKKKAEWRNRVLWTLGRIITNSKSPFQR